LIDEKVDELALVLGERCGGASRAMEDEDAVTANRLVGWQRGRHRDPEKRGGRSPESIRVDQPDWTAV
jgi:hypothetical protein